MTATVVTTATELTQALASSAESIEVEGEISGMPMITLGAGVSLSGGTLKFSAKGVRLTKDNTLSDITITTAAHELAVLNDMSVDGWGTLTLKGVKPPVRFSSSPGTRSDLGTSRSTGSPSSRLISAAGWSARTASVSTRCRARLPYGTSRRTQPWRSPPRS